MEESMYKESPNTRPGEPLRSWTAATDVVRVDAIFTVRMANARSALTSIIAGEKLEAEDVMALARLNSYSVVRWYEPIVTFLPDPHIDPAIAGVFGQILSEV